MFSSKFETIVKEHPEWESQLRNIEKALARARSGQTVDPTLIATTTSLKLGEVVALLQVLAEKNIGRFRLTVVDEHGSKVRTFSRYSEIPDIVPDKFGNEIHVQPQNVELLFELA